MACLVERFCELVRSGVGVDDILVVASSVDAADELRDCLRDAVGPAGVPKLRVSSTRSLALRLAGEETGHQVRVLTHAERAVLLVDLRARGFSGEQVGEALAVAQRAWRLGEGPSRPGADACLAALLDELEVRGALLQEALFARAMRRARGASDEGALYVLVDRADLMPPAALRLCDFLVGDELWATQAGGAPCLEPTEPPVELPAPTRRLGARRAHVVKWADAAEEAAGVAAFARQTLAAGLRPGDLFIACPNRTWVRRIADAMERVGVAACSSSDRPPLSGDPRDARASADLRVFAALGLLAEPGDVASWRTWCGVGRPDLAAAAWRRLEERAASRGQGLGETLAQVGRSEAPAASISPGDRVLAERVAAGWGLIRACDGRRGRALLDSLGGAGVPVPPDLVADGRGLVGSPDDARALFDRMHARVVEQRFGRGDACVRVGHVSSLAGLHPRVLVLAGCNDGLVDDSVVLGALAQHRDEVLVSYVQRMPADTAERQGARVRRTRREAGDTVALLAPSPAIAALGPEVPSTTGGQQFCATTLNLRP